jgi:hypothetical protein
MTLCRSGPGVSAIVPGKCDSSAGKYTNSHTYSLGAYARMHICDVRARSLHMLAARPSLKPPRAAVCNTRIIYTQSEALIRSAQ